MASEHVRRQSELVVRLDGSVGEGRGLFAINALLEAELSEAQHALLVGFILRAEDKLVCKYSKLGNKMAKVIVKEVKMKHDSAFYLLESNFKDKCRSSETLPFRFKSLGPRLNCG